MFKLIYEKILLTFNILFMTKQIITPEIWGPHGWKFMHYLSFGYPDNPTTENKNHYKTFFLSLQHVLPCSICARHYSDNLVQYSLDDALENKDALIRWVIDIHNDVNEIKGKKIRIQGYLEEFSLSRDEADQLIMSARNIIYK